MATTTNFGWETPDDTDLVKDGAAAIRTLGQAIDTSMADLEGGTTGQVLSKASNTDMDFTWVTSDDANAIQNSLVDAKGDLIGATADNTPARIPVGANGFVLTADSAEALGVKWAAAGSTGFSGVRVYKSTAQSCANATGVILTWENESYDTNGFHDNATNNSRITIPTGKAGYYYLTCTYQFAGNATGLRSASVKKNGTGGVFEYTMNNQGSTAGTSMTLNTVISAVVGDYFQVDAYQESGGSLNVIANNNGQSTFSMTYLGA